MTAENDKSLSSEMLKARNAILIEFGDYSFDQALDEIKNSLLRKKIVPSGWHYYLLKAGLFETRFMQ